MTQIDLKELEKRVSKALADMNTVTLALIHHGLTPKNRTKFLISLHLFSDVGDSLLWRTDLPSYFTSYLCEFRYLCGKAEELIRMHWGADVLISPKIEPRLLDELSVAAWKDFMWEMRESVLQKELTT